MGKRRTEMKLIENEKARKRVFEKRRTNLLKKAKELSILCDIKLLLIIYEHGKVKAEIWPHNNVEAEQIIEWFKQRRIDKTACDSSASKRRRFGDKFDILDHKNMVNHYSENQLRNLIFELDAKIAAVMNVIQSKLVLKGGAGSPKNKGKGKEAVIYQEPIKTPQHQSFQTYWPKKNFISYPEFENSSSIPYVPLPVHYVDPSSIQSPYKDANSSMGYYDPNVHPVLPCIYYPKMPGFPPQMNASDLGFFPPFN
ncbi:MADS-box protein FLOWERING LOCUS C-like [Gossypium arboreum]|uniref:MADS-box domain-containing protein n=1 Tax=Gossypium arboreum TaxID=29729 RepID=A0ABR0MLT3_GOSAR|nr:MADS-box protein FLOWERING LOCUS C-like [Gossypium arboreum]KAK5774966.1 hypothetical protein PVK06_042830 [Gossypium arboreum]